MLLLSGSKRSQKIPTYVFTAACVLRNNKYDEKQLFSTVYQECNMLDRLVKKIPKINNQYRKEHMQTTNIFFQFLALLDVCNVKKNERKNPFTRSKYALLDLFQHIRKTEQTHPHGKLMHY